MEKVKVEICMGSSCFARGNSEALTNIESYIQEHHLDDKVELVGHLCMDQCSQGPNITIDGVVHHQVDSSAAVDLLADALAKKGIKA